MDWAAPRAKILLFGVSDPAASACISPHTIFSKELTLLASSGMTPASFDAALALLRSGQVDPTLQETTVIALADLPAHLLGQAQPAAGKLLVRPHMAGEAQR